MRNPVLAIVFAAAVIGTGGIAQAQSTGDQCKRAWLASYWPTVVSECLALADDSEAKKIEYKAQANNLRPGAPSDLVTGALQIACADEFFAAKARARASLAYAKLKRMSASTEQHTIATSDASSAYQGATSTNLNTKPEDIAKVQALQTLLASPKFLNLAPTADVLEQI